MHEYSFGQRPLFGTTERVAADEDVSLGIRLAAERWDAAFEHDSGARRNVGFAAVLGRGGPIPGDRRENVDGRS